MKIRRVEERVGEYLGPVDWSYDFTKHDWSPGRGGVNSTVSAQCVAILHQISVDPGAWEATTDGGSPPCGWGRVLRVGMWDGWPHWEPTPAVEIDGWLGPSWHSFYMIRGIRPYVGRATP